MLEFSKCIDVIASSRKKGLTVLFDQIEQEVCAKQTFIVSQQEQLVNMQMEYEFLVEQRSVVEKAQHVIFGKREKKSNLEEFFSGDTDQVGQFINQTERNLVSSRSDPMESNR